MPHNFAYIGPAKTAEEALERLLAPHKVIAVDTETILLNGEKRVLDGEEMVYEDAKTCIGIGIATSPTEAYYFPMGQGHEWANVPILSHEAMSSLYAKLLRPWERKVYFNAPFDLDRIEDRLNLPVGSQDFDDVAKACHIQGLWNGLDQVVGWLLNEDHVDIKTLLKSKDRRGITMLDIPFPEVAQKNFADTRDTLKVYYMMRLEEWSSGERGVVWQDRLGNSYTVTKEMADCYRVEIECIPILRKMSSRGVYLRPDLVDKWHKQLTEEVRIYDRVFRQEGFNPASDQQVGVVLANRGHWLPVTPSGRQLKVDEDHLVTLKDPLAHMILARRKRSKLLSTYIKPAKDREKGYGHYRSDLATGRTASYDWNWQNWPSSLREIFSPDDPDDDWTWMDFSQIEMRLAAVFSKDPTMLKAYREYDDEWKRTGSPPSYGGIHQVTMETLYPGKTKYSHPDLYVNAKSYNFAMLYLATAETLAKTTRRPLKECDEFRKIWLAKYDALYNWMLEQAGRDDRKVPTIFGRYCRIPDEIHVTEDHQQKCRINYRIQGSAADILKRAMIICDRDGIDFPIQVHDEIVADGGDVEFNQELNQICSEVFTPFEVHRARRWE